MLLAPVQGQKGLCPVWVVQQGLPKMNLLFPGHPNLKASRALVCDPQAVWIPVTLLFLWAG